MCLLRKNPDSESYFILPSRDHVSGKQKTFVSKLSTKIV